MTQSSKQSFRFSFGNIARPDFENEKGKYTIRNNNTAYDS